MEITPSLKLYGETFGGTAEVTVNPDTKEGVATLLIGVHLVVIRSGEELYDKVRKGMSKDLGSNNELVARAIFCRIMKQAYGRYQAWLLEKVTNQNNVKVRISTKGYKILYRGKLVCNTSVDTENYKPWEALKACSESAQERLYEIYSGQDLISLHVINNIEKHIF